MNYYLRLLLVAVLGGVFLGIFAAVLGIEFTKNVPGINRLLYVFAWMAYGAFFWNAVDKKK
jgi:hypothetical protein